eukprot:TRINITY_DN3924_c0_g1_i3.p1 TRINITY_DN3924_c0_g1~~TRINITY_DN3924_c0_g1_i3.p1  ORF type:complete len:606 (-),score=112.89 TRINITY_DN3924_c0_g1_i3:169-1986(-)
MAKREEAEDGVLLYYKYASVPDLSHLFHFYDSNCKSLGLLGRVRIAPDGVNVTVGGKMSSLEKHISIIKSNELFKGTDFKLASCHSPSNERVAKECGFTSLSIREVKELVTFSPYPFLKSPAISNAGRHLSAVEFHSVLQNGGNSLEDNGSDQNKGLILLDARNVYETRIGKFQTPNVETLDPNIRQYSDLPAWIDNHSEQLRGNHILMYCTGGIRCEMASAYIRSKGAGYENVFQLFGGIQRYMEQFPDGGFFKGKNFVFDHRISVGSFDTDIVGSCLLCDSPFDDYSSRCRCNNCRMLVLVCDSCQEKACSKYICELCQKHRRGDMPVQIDRFHPQSTHESGAGDTSPRKLQILCLHGFRQNASNFKGRTASLAKKLKNMAELVFVNAPHELPFIYLPHSPEPNNGPDESSSEQNCNVSDATQHCPPPRETCKKRFAWLVMPQSDDSAGTDWKVAEEPFDPLQYQQQTAGFDESYAFLKTIFSQMGPFDGVLGFSQGAAMAALLCAQQEIDNSIQCFRFAILCSGFSLFSTKSIWGSLNCPSLHIFGNGQGKKDRQIARQASMDLLSLFDKGSAVVIEHESGHIIPTQSPYIDRVKDFLQRFL